MQNIQKAIGAAHGGFVSGGIITAAAVGTIIPAGVQMPWWGYLVLWLCINIVTCLFPAFATWLAPRNEPITPVISTLPQPVPLPVQQPSDQASPQP